MYAEVMDYIGRYADAELAGRLKQAGAVVVTGVKACGKTETARRAASSEVLLESDETVASAIAYDPSIVLEGPAPLLLDEWQEYPKIWNLVRREVDARRTSGQFILTGSSNPTDQVKLHSGV